MSNNQTQAGCDQCGGCGAACGGCGGAECDGSFGTCGGCGIGGTLWLTEGEAAVLLRFGEIPFWPVGRRADGEEPVCLEEGMEPPVLQSLALKGLIRLDYDLPLTNFDYAAYAACIHRGSMALTAAGQRAVELLEIQGAEP